MADAINRRISKRMFIQSIADLPAKTAQNSCTSQKGAARVCFGNLYGRFGRFEGDMIGNCNFFQKKERYLLQLMDKNYIYINQNITWQIQNKQLIYI